MYFQVQINKETKYGISEFIFSTLSEVIAFYAVIRSLTFSAKIIIPDVNPTQTNFSSLVRLN